MPAGIAIFRGDGATLLDGSYRVTRVIGAIYLAGSGGSVAVDGGGSVWWSFQAEALFTPNNLNQHGTSIPRFSISGNVLSWYYPSGAPSGAEIVSGWLFYGVH